MGGVQKTAGAVEMSNKHTTSNTRQPNMKFLGRTLDINTMTYSFQDGSGGKLPVEMQQDVMNATHRHIKFKDGTKGGNGLCVLGTIWEWKNRLGLNS